MTYSTWSTPWGTPSIAPEFEGYVALDERSQRRLTGEEILRVFKQREAFPAWLTFVPVAPPPREARLLLRYALPRKHREHIIGDLDEDYCTKWLPEHGLRQARRLYWWHAIRSIAPWLWLVVIRSGSVTAVLGAAEWVWQRLG